MKKSIYFDGVFQTVTDYFNQRKNKPKQANDNDDCSRVFGAIDPNLLKAATVLKSYISNAQVPDFGVKKITSINTSGQSSNLLKKCCGCSGGISYTTRNAEREKVEGLLKAWHTAASKWKGDGFPSEIELPKPAKPSNRVSVGKKWLA